MLEVPGNDIPVFLIQRLDHLVDCGHHVTECDYLIVRHILVQFLVVTISRFGEFPLILQLHSP